MRRSEFSLTAFLVALVVVLRFVPHPFGVSSIGAWALYSGANFRLSLALPICLLPLAFSHWVLGVFDLTVMGFVYAGFAASVLVGRLLLAMKRSSMRHASAVIAGAIVFYVISNFAVWLVGYYPPTGAGLLACYLAGLPYLASAILGDALYCMVFFGVQNWRQSKVAVVQPA